VTYREDTSHTVVAGDAPNATPIGINATASIDEFTGLSMLPSTSGMASLFT
jgi:hypothetical protein